MSDVKDAVKAALNEEQRKQGLATRFLLAIVFGLGTSFYLAAHPFLMMGLAFQGFSIPVMAGIGAFIGFFLGELIIFVIIAIIGLAIFHK